MEMIVLLNQYKSIQMNQQQTRKLPKKTVITISIIVILGILTFVTLQTLKVEKFSEVLFELDHKNIKNLKVVNKQSVEDMQTKFKTTVYKVVFDDLDLNKNCIGFIYRDKNGNYIKDIDCK